MYMKHIAVFALVTLFQLSQAHATSAQLQPFETDGCTLFAEGTPQKPELWKHCCFEHDLRYWFGGEMPDRDFADLQLKQCVQDVAGSFWAQLIYKGVRDGHNSPIQHRLHWSWGWTPERSEAPLSPDEKTYIRNQLNQLSIDTNYIQQFILKYRLN